MTTSASSTETPDPKQDPINVLTTAVDLTITRVTAALDAAASDTPHTSTAPGDTATGGTADEVTDALHDYIVTVGPVQMELAWLRQADHDGPLNSAMTHLGNAFAQFHGGDDTHGLSELRTARNELAKLANRHTADDGGDEIPANVQP